MRGPGSRCGAGAGGNSHPGGYPHWAFAAGATGAAASTAAASTAAAVELACALLAVAAFGSFCSTASADAVGLRTSSALVTRGAKIWEKKPG